MKERVTLTLNQQILRRVDSLIDGYQIKNRSHAVELMLIKALGTNVPSKAVFLAGGNGIKLEGNQVEIPKAMIPVGSRTVGEHFFDLLKKFDIRDVVMAVGNMKEQIKEHYGNGDRYGLKILYLEEDEDLGTAGPLKRGRHLFNESFIVSYSDNIIDLNIEQMYRLHKSKNALVTVALTTVDDPSNFGVARLSGSNILEFVEKPEKDSNVSNLISAGFYIVEPIVLDLIPSGHASLEKDIFPKLAADGKLVGYPFGGKWFDMTVPEFYKRALDMEKKE